MSDGESHSQQWCAKAAAPRAAAGDIHTTPEQDSLFPISICRWGIPSADTFTRKGASPQQMEMAHRWPVPRR